ncbi:DNA polymerase III subunit chi [Alteromonas sp. C1M14]|uniref:DNA polymerase III subunit chi n=1 Tax=Alteromonas sp. C1M14 TaxID=2841567 RepID=UPI001C09C94E|nr:DNA polymerase III subunit chi [Alteromonas sp. C1M14]MBU2979523.1 DNA polymerase III subunit chi [Alteromonas sp. C1M14]
MPQVTFWQLTDEADGAEPRACHLVADAYANKKKIAVLCANQASAEAVDELLWQLPADRFVPHNMYGEGPGPGTPVEICWQENQLSRRSLLVNLSGEMLSSPGSFQTIYDFVPVADDAKQAARVRYKQYQQAGCQLQFKSADS